MTAEVVIAAVAAVEVVEVVGDVDKEVTVALAVAVAVAVAVADCGPRPMHHRMTPAMQFSRLLLS